VNGFHTKPLDKTTWPDFGRLVEKHNGVWGGCWCMSFHLDDRGFKNRTVLQNRTEKEHRVRDGRAHAALVYDGSAAVGWCQFGPTDELPRIKYKRAYFSGLTDPPDWRITCFFVDRGYRGKGVASVALKGALREISRLGGGTVESYPEDAAGRSVSASFLHNGTVSMFEREGFKRSRRLGKNHWVVTKVVRKSSRKRPPAQR
jgi:GNAT superfamily N-acetyltransferase